MRHGLIVEVRDGLLVIQIPVNTLAWAAEHKEPPIKIENEAELAKSVLHVLLDEGEDGSTRVTRLLDVALEEVVEQGMDGPDYGDLENDLEIDEARNAE